MIVADDGKGLPESDLERVLRPFERGDTARGNASGTGLGLSIVNRVAKTGGGSVRLAQNIPNGLSVQMTNSGGSEGFRRQKTHRRQRNAGKG